MADYASLIRPTDDIVSAHTSELAAARSTERYALLEPEDVVGIVFALDLGQR